MIQQYIDNQWHVTQAMYGQAEKAKDVFSKHSIAYYIPMKSVPDTSKNRKGDTKLAPILSHLIFVDSILE